MCTNPQYIKLAFDSKRSYVLNRLYPEANHDLDDWLPVNCGKCLDCLKHRQDEITTRIFQESKKFRKMFFLTFTYREEVLPFAKSLWRIDRESGEYMRLTCPEIVDRWDTSYIWLYDILKDTLSVKRNTPRIHEFPVESFSDSSDKYDYVVRITPSINCDDIQKVFAVWRERMRRRGFGPKTFSYAVVGEFGHHKTCRPHYHICLMTDSLSDYHVKNLCHLWYERFGGYDFRFVPCRMDNKGRDQFSLIAKYIGKYVSKGPFDVCSSRDGLTVKMRFLTSKNFGSFLSLDKKNEILCKDMFQYDVWKAHEQLSKDDFQSLIENISRRSFISVRFKDTANTKRFIKVGLPMQVQMNLYEVKKSDYDASICWPPLYYAVKNYVHNRFVADDLRQYEVLSSAKSLSEVARQVAFITENKRQAACAKERSVFKSLQQFYSTHNKL